MMAGSLSFTIVFESKGAGYFSALEKLCQDFSVPFQNIIGEWAKHNAEKFRRGKGAELWGVQQADDVIWEPVTAAYYKQKHGPVKRGSRQLFADWLMVRTGDLMRSLTRRGGFAEYVGPTKAVFGQPIDEEDAQKAAQNWVSRQTIFLDLSDKRMVRSHIGDYFRYGADYMTSRRQLAAEKAKVRKEVAQLDIAFEGAVRNL